MIDRGNDRIQEFDTEGNFIRQWSKTGVPGDGDEEGRYTWLLRGFRCHYSAVRRSYGRRTNTASLLRCDLLLCFGPFKILYKENTPTKQKVLYLLNREFVHILVE